MFSNFKLKNQEYKSKEESSKIEEQVPSKEAEVKTPVETPPVEGEVKKEDKETTEKNKPAETPVDPPKAEGTKTDEDILKEATDKVNAILQKPEDKRTKEDNDFLEVSKASGINVEKEDDYTPLIKSLAKDGTILIDDSKEYKGEEGFKASILDTVNKKHEEYKAKYGDTVKELLTYLDNGGKFEDFQKVNSIYDYSTVDLENEDGSEIEENQIGIVEEWATLLKKNNPEEAQLLAQALKDKGKLKDKAEQAKKELIKYRTDTIKALTKEAEERSKAEAKRIKEDQDNLRTKVETLEKIGDIVIEKKEAKKLADYMTKPVKNGKTQLQIDSENETNKFKQAYFMMKGFSFEDIEKKTETKVTEALRTLLSKGSTTGVERKNNPDAPRETQQVKAIKRLSFIPSKDQMID